MISLGNLLRPLLEKLSPRERLGLGYALAAVVVVLTWVLLIAPAWRQISSATHQRLALDQSLSTMQQQAAEAVQLKADTALVESNLNQVIQAATQLHLGAGSQTKLSADKATVTVTATTSTGLAQWMSTVRQNAHAKPLEAHLTKTGALWGGTIVLALPVKAATP